MNLCSDGHEEICYEGRGCPLCSVIKENKEKEKELDKLQAEIDELKQKEG